MFKSWYIEKMIESHNLGKFTERNTYAKAAGLDLLEMLSICGGAKCSS